jgi:bifunctional UDP-N-acetylglucosamine pyrophosphorylase/glucosamine-1-phosphate N-acetyltransferase
VLEGDNTFGKGVTVGPNCVIKNTRIADNVEILANSVIDDADIESNCHVGPFARIRPGTLLQKGARIGNFVETKKSRIGPGSKANHLAYIGDTDVGSNTNIGAGVITCNYDGANKHQTIIGNDVFVGSDCQLIAPVTIEDGATIGAGTTLTIRAPAKQLTFGRAKARTLPSWERPKKKVD